MDALIPTTNLVMLNLFQYPVRVSMEILKQVQDDEVGC